MFRKSLFSVLVLAVLFSPLASRGCLAQDVTRIAIVGDSTVADYPAENPMRGWGQLLPEFIKSGRVILKNFAVGGRSTKTFKSEGRWDKVLEFGPKYVFIQFGHNDSHAPGLPESTDAKTDFSANLREFVNNTKSKNGVPILVTPMHRGTWKQNGLQLTDEMLAYAQATRQVAAELNTPLIDLYALSEQSFEQMGDENLKTLFAAPDVDRTHFNEKGARLLAQWVLLEANKQSPDFRRALSPIVNP